MGTIPQDLQRPVVGVAGAAVIVLLVVTAFSSPAGAHTGDDGLHHHDGWMGTHGGMGGWMAGGLAYLWMLLGSLTLIGIPVGLVYLLLTRRESRGGPADDDALTILRRRYAQGEIDEEEFETRRMKLLTERN